MTESEVAPDRSGDIRLVFYVVVGGALGVLYVVLDIFSEARIRSGTLTGAFASAHAVIDHVSPILVGGLLGVCAHYLRLRARLSAAEDAAGRAEAIRTRLLKVERDQAVWVLAAAVLHELNNPLHALVLLLDELAAPEAANGQKSGGRAPDRQLANELAGATCGRSLGDEAPARDELLGRARAQAERALSQLKLLRSMRSAGEPEFQAIALERILGALADDVSPLAAEDGLVVRLECEGPVQANADPAYVRTILENLVDNSLSSLRERGGGNITIRLASEEGRAIVRVLDDGPPFDPSVRASLFEPLRTTKTRGMGLGLPIARALARAMRGELSLENAEGKAFRLELPLRNGL
jgi:signal transduction histidine kinase